MTGAGPALPATAASGRWTWSDLADRHARALQLRLGVGEHGCRPGVVLALVLLHAAGLALVARLTGHTYWLAVLPALLAGPAIVSIRCRRLLALESLAPLGLAYGLALVRLALAALTGGVGGPRVPEPWGTLLDLDVAVLVGATWALLAQVGPLAGAFGRRVAVAPHLGRILAGLTLTWAVVTYLGLRTQGVTASDPYAYAQMAFDLAASGSPLHVYPLAREVAGWGLPTGPTAPVGYAAPDPPTGLAASAWPPGYSAVLALAIRLLGEPGVYLVTPGFGLLALAATWLLALEVGRGLPSRWAWLGAGIAVFALATSYEQINQTLVPMADVPAQAFTTLAVLCALRSPRSRTLTFAALAGLFLGCAFAVRYTQVLVALALLAAWWTSALLRRGETRRMLAAPIVAGAAALVPALPVLWFNAVAFGHPFATGSAELGLFDLASVPGNLVALAGDLLRPDEFLWLAPFAGLGAAVVYRLSPPAAAALLAWLVALVAFHLPYAALRLRDLLSVFPVLAVWGGVGAAWPAYRRASTDRPLRPALVAAAIVAALWVRTVHTLEATVPGVAFSGFGYLLPEQRAAFDDVARRTPPDAIVASTLNGGPVGLYSGRDAVRPAAWSADDWLAFLERARAAGRPVFILDDGDEMAGPREQAARRFRLEPVASLPLPYFSPEAGSTNRRVDLLAVLDTPARDAAAPQRGLHPRT